MVNDSSDLVSLDNVLPDKDDCDSSGNESMANDCNDGENLSPTFHQNGSEMVGDCNQLIYAGSQLSTISHQLVQRHNLSKAALTYCCISLAL